MQLITSRKKQHTFKFPFVLKQQVVENLKIVTKVVGHLEVEAIGYIHQEYSYLEVNDRYSVDIEFIRWNGTDMRPVVEVLGGMEDIEDAAIRELAQLDHANRLVA